MASDPLRVTVWNEYRHERSNAAVGELYPKGMHGVIAEYLNGCVGITAGTATLDQPEHGLSADVLGSTDVLVWWGHTAHDEVKDEIVDRAHQRVLAGMGLIVLHSGHYSKIFRRLMGTNCSLKWRESGEKERVWNLAPGHEIAQGIGEYFELPHSEMYGERFDIPEPDKLIFISWFAGGEVFRSGCAWERGQGRVFYFAPGHETFPIYHDQNVLRVIGNAARWARPRIVQPTTG
jgi:trehalose utilization protein